jgi:hypothetical protein
MRNWIKPGGSLGVYSRFPIAGFDSFGKPFDHLFDKAPKQRLKKDGQGSCSGGNAADCPVNNEKQDGHHANVAKFMGWDEKEHPKWHPLAKQAGNERLFVNWHPAPLGHEVIGNQVAYYHLGVLEKALGQITNAQKEGKLPALTKKFEDTAAPQPLPQYVACKKEVCDFLEGDKAKCAYSFLPKAQGPDVGDWMVNDTTTGTWYNKIVDNQRTCERERYDDCLKNNPDTPRCFDLARGCSYWDQKRGIYGNASSGKISFAFENMYHCKIWLGEPPYEWSKPAQLANWHNELEFTLNGKPCKAPTCVVKNIGGYLQSAYIDARSVMGSKCRREPVRLDIQIKPTKAVQCTTSGECKPDGAWKDYNPSVCKSSGGKCSADPNRWTKPEEVHTFISQIITF